MIDTLKIMGDFISAISPLIVGLLSFYVTKVNSDNKKMQKVQKENNILLIEKRKQEDNKIKDRIKRVEDTADDLQRTCNSIQNDLGNIEEINKVLTEKLDKLIILNEITMEYSRSISTVMVAIGGGLADNPSIACAIEKHRSDESEIINKIMKTSY